jgi:MFS family permease
MDTTVSLVALASFMGGLLVTSRMLGWVALLISSVKTEGRDGAHTRSLFAIGPLLVHSGPWTLLLAAAGVYYAARSPDRAYLVAVIAGLGLAMVFIIVGSLIAVLRQRRPRAEPPLTPERFLAIRRKFFWGNSLLFGFLASLVAMFQPWSSRSDAPSFAVLFFILGFPAGWAWSWFMWQWYGAALQVKEKRRKEREDAV